MSDVYEHAKMFNIYKPNYETLNGLFTKRLPKDTQVVRVFFDLDASTTRLFSPMNEEISNKLAKDEQLYAASEIVNIIGHYRHYFWKHMNLPTDFVLYYSSVGVPDYMTAHYNKRLGRIPEWKKVSDYTKKCLNLARRIIEFIPNAYLVDTKDLDPAALPWVMNNEIYPAGNGHVNVIITNKKFCYQYINMKRTLLMNYMGVNTKLITRQNAVAQLTKKEDIDIDPKLLTLLFTIAGEKDSEFTPLIPKVGTLKTIKILSKMIEAGMISRNIYDINTFLDDTKEFEEERELIISRYNALNVFKSSTSLQKANIESQLINKYDWDGLKSMNVLHFPGYPIHLEFIVDGESYE